MLVLVISDSAETLLLCRRGPQPLWQSVTGSLLPGETPAAAARRELCEETGITDCGRMLDTGVSKEFEIFPQWRHRFAPGVTHNLEHRFELRVEHAGAVQLSRHEHRGYAWVTPEEALGRMFSWTNREALRQALSRQRPGS